MSSKSFIAFQGLPSNISSGRQDNILKMTNGGLRRSTDGSPRLTHVLLRLIEVTLRSCQMTSHWLQKATEDLLKPTGVISELASGVADAEKNLPTTFS